MRPHKFSINPPRERLEYTKSSSTGSMQKQGVAGYGTATKWDYFLNPDRFFAGIFNGDAPLGVPLLMLLLSIIIPGILFQVLAVYLGRFVPYLDLPNMGLGFYPVLPMIGTWILGILYFLIFSGGPAHPSAKTRSWAGKGTRIFSAMGFAIIPVIVSALISVAALLVILHGITIVPPPTAAYEVYQQANADDERSVHQTFASMGPGKAPDQNLAEQRMKYRQIMTAAKAAAEDEATEGLKQLAPQVLQNPVILQLGSALTIVSIIILFWTGVLLTYGIRHALEISLTWSAILVGIPVCLNLFLRLGP